MLCKHGEGQHCIACWAKGRASGSCWHPPAWLCCPENGQADAPWSRTLRKKQYAQERTPTKRPKGSASEKPPVQPTWAETHKGRGHSTASHIAPQSVGSLGRFGRVGREQTLC